MSLAFSLGLSLGNPILNKGALVPASRSALVANLKYLTVGGKYLTVEKANG